MGGKALLECVEERGITLLCLSVMPVILGGFSGCRDGCCGVVSLDCVVGWWVGCSGGGVGCGGVCDGGLAKEAREDGDLSESRKFFMIPSKIGSFEWKRSSAATLSKLEGLANSGHSSAE